MELRRLSVLLIALALCASVLFACGDKDGKKSAETTRTAAVTTTNELSSQDKESETNAESDSAETKPATASETESLPATEKADDASSPVTNEPSQRENGGDQAASAQTETEPVTESAGTAAPDESAADTLPPLVADDYELPFIPNSK